MEQESNQKAEAKSHERPRLERNDGAKMHGLMAMS
jgi:hypothetical protein